MQSFICGAFGSVDIFWNHVSTCVCVLLWHPRHTSEQEHMIKYNIHAIKILHFAIPTYPDIWRVKFEVDMINPFDFFIGAGAYGGYL